MSSYLDNQQNFTFRNALAPFAQDQDLPLAEVLSEADVVRIFAEEKVSFGKLAHSFWTPAITLWAFLWQVISPDKSCWQVVANVLMSFALSYEPEDIDTSLYCRRVPSCRRPCYGVWLEWHWSVTAPNTKSLRHMTLRYLSASTKPS